MHTKKDIKIPKGYKKVFSFKHYYICEKIEDGEITDICIVSSNNHYSVLNFYFLDDLKYRTIIYDKDDSFCKEYIEPLFYVENNSRITVYTLPYLKRKNGICEKTGLMFFFDSDSQESNMFYYYISELHNRLKFNLSLS